MADDARVEVRGFSELAAGTATLARRIEASAPAEFVRVAESVAAQVSSTVPRRTGALAASAEVFRSGDTASVGYGGSLRYAPFAEYGGKGHPTSAQGNYLYPAAESSEPLLAAAGREAAAKEIRGMTWPKP